MTWPFWGFLLGSTIPASQFVWPVGRGAGAVVKSRPPPWFFGIIWSIIVVIIGFVWYIVAKKQEAGSTDERRAATATLWGLGITVALCIMWMSVYSKNRKYGVFVMWPLVATLLATALTASRLSIIAADLLVIPIVWATYAAVLNMLEVEKL